MVQTFLNFTNHPSSSWTKEQYDEALKLSGAQMIVDLAYPKVDPEADEEEIYDLAEDYHEKIKALHPEVVMVQGEMGLMFDLIQMLLKDNIKVVYACSERVAQENINGNGEAVRTSLFKFVRFREFRLVE